MRFAMVCASNMNRSMEAHAALAKEGMQVESYGIGKTVKLPGPSADAPNVYPFGTPYTEIEADLAAKDPDLYARTGLLAMARRNAAVKPAPQRWQDAPDLRGVDCAVTFEGRVMDALATDMAARGSARGGGATRPLLVVNLDVPDTAGDAAAAAPLALALCRSLAAAPDGEWEDELDAICDAFEAETGRPLLYTICYH